VEKSDKRQLEGLLQARSEDLRHGRRPGRPRRVPAPVSDPHASVVETPPAAATSSVRPCEGGGGEIGKRRMRAMPRATRCLDCQRSAESAAAPL
jgi:hypothetical protein